MKELFQVKIIYEAFVVADSHEDAERVADEERAEIVGDTFNPQIEVEASFRSRKELDAYGDLSNSTYDHDTLPYGDSQETIGKILDDLEERDIAWSGRCTKTPDMFDEPPVLKQSQPKDLPDAPNFRLILARKHANAGPDWMWCSMEHIDNGNYAGTLIRGAVPNIAPDGKARWVGVYLETVFVLETELRAAELEYESETGKCFECGGSKKKHRGWHHEHGHKYVPCDRCGATGKAVQHD